MKIITTTTIEISEENEPFISYIVYKSGGLLDGETNEEAVIRLRNNISFMNAYGQIAPHIESYFGDAGKAQSSAIIHSLNNGAITVNSTIE